MALNKATMTSAAASNTEGSQAAIVAVSLVFPFCRVHWYTAAP
jgi:hypothetical protein